MNQRPDGPGEIPLGTGIENDWVDQWGAPLATLTSGEFAVVWLAASQQQLRMQWIDLHGGILFQPGGLIVAEAVTGDVGSGVITSNPLGGAFVGFQTTTPSGLDFFVQSFDATGDPVWPAGGLAPSLLQDSVRDTPALVADGVGGVYACFGLLVNPGIWCQHFDADGNQLLWPASGVLAGGQDGLSVTPHVVSDGAGGLLVFWRNHGDPFGGPLDPLTIEGQHFDSSGQPLWGPGLPVHETGILEQPNYGPNELEAVSDGAGGAIVAFNDFIDQTTLTLDVVAQRVSSDGTLLWGTGTSVAVGSTQFQHETTIAAPDGGAVIAVQEVSSDSISRILLIRLGPTGQHLWPSGIELSAPDGPALNYGTVGSFDDGLLQVAWTHQQIPFTLEMDVRLARFNGAGTALDPANGLVVTTRSDLQVSRALAFAPATGKTFVLWDDRRSGDWNNLDTYGALLSGLDVLFMDGFESGDILAW